MSWLQFVSTMAQALAWPIVVLLLVILLRHRILGMLNPEGGLRRVKAGPLEAEWGREVLKAEEALESSSDEIRDAPIVDRTMRELLAQVEQSPSEVTLRAHRRLLEAIEARLRDAGVARPIRRGRPLGIVALARLAQANGLLSEQTVEAVKGLTVLRNIAAHDPRQVDPAQASDYVALADAVLFAIQGGVDGPIT